VTGRQLTLDDCQPDWPHNPQPKPHRPRGTRYWPGLHHDFWGQRLRTRRIVTIPLTGSYL
jgi:hypothetical protein